MRDPLRLTLVCWETRNWRHHKNATEWCKNYGLKSFTKTIYAGNLNTQERKRIETFFADVFIKKTEKYYFFPLHGSIIENITGKEGGAKEKIRRDSAFEII